MNEKQANDSQVYCQSCGMPMTEAEHFGTNGDGSKNEDYCAYCYKNGAFTGDMSMEEMIETCMQYGYDPEKHGDKETARETMRQWFPTLKRWKAG